MRVDLGESVTTVDDVKACCSALSDGAARGPALSPLFVLPSTLRPPVNFAPAALQTHRDVPCHGTAIVTRRAGHLHLPLGQLATEAAAEARAFRAAAHRGLPVEAAAEAAGVEASEIASSSACLPAS